MLGIGSAAFGVYIFLDTSVQDQGGLVYLNLYDIHCRMLGYQRPAKRHVVTRERALLQFSPLASSFAIGRQLSACVAR